MSQDGSQLSDGAAAAAQRTWLEEFLRRQRPSPYSGEPASTSVAVAGE